MNLSNQLTLSRLFLTILFIGALSISTSWSAFIALIIFALAAFTDWLDGYIARRYELCTNVGQLLDPLADKILVTAALICLIPLGAFPAWVVTTIIAREFLVTGLRLLAREQGIIIAADTLGKHKTAWQFITILFFLILLTAKEFLGANTSWIGWAWSTLGPILIAITLLLTIISGISYLWRSRSLLH